MMSHSDKVFHRGNSDNLDGKLNGDSFTPSTESEATGFLLPEDEIEVKMHPRFDTTDPNTASEFKFKDRPLYLSICYDEFSRNFITYEVGKNSQPTVELDSTTVNMDADDEVVPHMVLKHYNPGYEYWTSTFRSTPKDIKHHLTGHIPRDSNYMIRVNNCMMKNNVKAFEPLFGCATLYTFIGEDIYRISESFHFDLTQQPIRKDYKEDVYGVEHNAEIGTQGSSFQVGDGTGGDNAHLNNYMITIPEELKRKDLFLVIQVTKVLTTDADKALAPYAAKALPPDARAHKEAIERLSNFRQPLGFAVKKLPDEGSRTDISCILLAQKACISDSGLGQVIRSLYPSDGSNSVARYEQIEIEISMTLFDLGVYEQMNDRLKDYGLVVNNAAQQTPRSNCRAKLNMIPSQMQIDSPSSQSTTKSEFAFSSTLNVRKVMPLIPIAFPWAKAVSRQMKTKFDNSLFIYINQLDKFPSSFRNLCVKVEVIELASDLPENKKSPSIKTPQDTLCNIYNHQSMFGSTFVKETCTRVSYHARNPSTNDEIKIKLPEKLSPRHWIRFTVLHVHVKPQSKRSSILHTIIRSSADAAKEDMGSTVVAYGYLPIVSKHDNLIEDQEHHINMSLITAEQGTELPVMRVRTYAVSTQVSSSKEIQTLLKSAPISLGYCPSSTMPIEVITEICMHSLSREPKEIKLVASLQDVIKANSLELSRHFLVIMRILLRAVAGGTGAYNEGYMNPYKHCEARCQAFLTFLQIVDKIFGGSSSTKASDSYNEKEVLEAYIDYLYDEEMPLPEEYVELRLAIPETPVDAIIADRKLSTANTVEEDHSRDTLYRESMAHLSDTDHFELQVTDGTEEEAVISRASSGSDESPHASLKGGESFRFYDVSQETSPTRPTTEPVVVTADNSAEKEYNRAKSELNYDSDDLPLVPSSECETPFVPNKELSGASYPSIYAQNVEIIPQDITAHDTKDVHSQKTSFTPSSGVKISDRSSMRVAVDGESNKDLDRKSWGKFITDSMWSEGKLVGMSALHHDAADDAVDPAVLASEKYLDDIAQHVVLQAERIIEERLIYLAAYALVSKVEFKAAEGHVGDLKLTEESIRAGHRYRYSGQYEKGVQAIPFALEKSWFEAIDSGVVTDDTDILLNEQNTKRRLSQRIYPHVFGAKATLLPIQPIGPQYDNLYGYKDRANASFCEDPKSALATRWWPWLYEIITFQWGTILAMILSPSNIVNPKNVESIIASYPFGIELTGKSNSNNNLDGKKDVRLLLMEHGPLLLRFVYKSLVLRIEREKKRAPVLLDEQYFHALENLVILLTLEAAVVPSGLWRSRKIVSSLAHFLRSLYAVVAPLQVLRLIKSSFRSMRTRLNPHNTELRLLLIEELSLFDFFVAANFPYTLDAPVSFFKFEITETISFQIDAAAAMSYTACGIRYLHSPNPNFLSHLLIGEIAHSCTNDPSKREASWEIIRDLMVRHSYDARFQNKSMQQRIISMYLPLFDIVINDHEHIESLKFDSKERREMLAILLYLLSGIPDRVLRNKLRQMCTPNIADSAGFQARPEGGNPRVISLKRDKAYRREIDVHSYISPMEAKKSSLYGFCKILHCMIDTFEVPINANTSVGTSSKEADTFNILSPAVQPCEGLPESSTDSNVLSGNFSGAVNTVRRGSNADLLSTNAASSAPPPSAAASNRGLGNANSLLANLDQRMQTRNAAGGTTNRRSQGASSKGPEERKWVAHTTKMNADNNVQDKPKSMKQISKTQALASTQQLSVASIKVILRILWMMFQECPGVYDSFQVSSEQAAFVLRDVNIEESLLSGVINLQIVLFMRMTLAVLLHALYGNQKDQSFAELYLCANSVIRQFGARVFLAAVEDALQYWIRVTFFHFASESADVREAACNFFLCLARSSYHYLGSFTLIATTVLAVINDVVTEILDCNRQNINSYEDEDKVLRNMFDCIFDMKAVAKIKIAAADKKRRQNKSAFSASLISFLADLEIVLEASSDVRKHITHPVEYDFSGANLLDGPFDGRPFDLTKYSREKRKKTQSVAVKSSGFDIEEVMIRFLRAAEIYDTFKLPRLRMQWLENLTRLHEAKRNKAECGEVRWRIFLICQQVENIWQQLWSPRPPFAWRYRGGSTQELLTELSLNIKVGDPEGLMYGGDRNFYKVFTTALDMKPFRPWADTQQYWTHMEMALSFVSERYSAENLLHLAERASSHLIQLFRLTNRSEKIMAEYTRMASAIKTSNDRGITSTISLGTFYRVAYTGKGCPGFLRDKEFIFRNANHLHVSEFHTLVINHAKSVALPGAEVKIIHDGNTLQDIKEENVAYIIMNSVKVVHTQCNRPNSFRLISENPARNYRVDYVPRSSLAKFQMEDLNQARIFRYAQPFTMDGSRNHAKKIEDQWMKTTVLKVKDPFPFILTRQLVTERDVVVLSPIEVAIQDIEDRIESMETELENPVTKDTNNLMRIIQGTVMPQVNAGAAEVAKVFLSSNKIMNDEFSLQLKIEEVQISEELSETEKKFKTREINQELKKIQALALQLKVTFINFLHCSRLLLMKSRILLVPDVSILDPDSVLNERPASQNTSSFTVTSSRFDESPVNSVSRSSVDAKAGTTTNPLTTGTNITNNINPITQTPYTAQEINYIKWQMEMEKGFETLVKALYPYISDLRESDTFAYTKVMMGQSAN